MFSLQLWSGNTPGSTASRLPAIAMYRDKISHHQSFSKIQHYMFNITPQIVVLNMGTVKKIGAVILSTGFILAVVWVLGEFGLSTPLAFLTVIFIVAGGALYWVDREPAI
jgi:hypothetical protein